MPAFLTIEQESGQIFLNRFDRDGAPVGDTWHKDFDEAREQALYEYGEAVGPWTEIPSEITDVVTFGVDKARTINSNQKE